MNVLVTGATGFVGSHLCRGLLQRGYRVVGLSRSGRTENLEGVLGHERFQMLRVDLRDADAVRNLMEGRDIVACFHLAAQLPQREDSEEPFLSYDTNAGGTLNLLRAAHLGGVDRFIHASSIDVYTEPPAYLPVDEEHPLGAATVYGLGKLAAELWCRSFSWAMNVVVLRYSIVYGRGQERSRAVSRFAEQALHGRAMTLYGDGTQSNDFVHVSDVVEANLLALEREKPGTYNIGSGEEASVMDLATRIARLAGSQAEPALTGEASNRPFRFALDISKARERLGYSPRSLEEGLFEHIAELKGEMSLHELSCPTP